MTTSGLLRGTLSQSPPGRCTQSRRILIIRK